MANSANFFFKTVKILKRVMDLSSGLQALRSDIAEMARDFQNVQQANEAARKSTLKVNRRIDSIVGLLQTEPWQARNVTFLRAAHRSVLDEPVAEPPKDPKQSKPMKNKLRRLHDETRDTKKPENKKVTKPPKDPEQSKTMSKYFVSRQCWIIIYTSAESNPAVSKPVLLHRWR